MSLETVTKEEWDKNFKSVVEESEQNIRTYMQIYLQLLDLRSNYRQDYSTHRIIHQIDFDKGVITYKKGTKRQIGYQIPYKGEDK